MNTEEKKDQELSENELDSVVGGTTVDVGAGTFWNDAKKTAEETMQKIKKIHIPGVGLL